jgi:hypothetical protein
MIYCIHLTSSGGNINFVIQVFLLLFKMIMEEADLQHENAVS